MLGVLVGLLVWLAIPASVVMASVGVALRKPWCLVMAAGCSVFPALAFGGNPDWWWALLLPLCPLAAIVLLVRHRGRALAAAVGVVPLVIFGVWITLIAARNLMRLWSQS